jgi:hypothetical protein
MNRRLTVAVACALVLASSGGAGAARGRGKARVRKAVQAAPADHAGTHPTTTAGGDPFRRNRASSRSTHTPGPEHVRHVGVARVVDPRAARDAVRASSWEYAGRLRRIGQRIWSVMLGLSVSLSMTGGQLGKALSPRPVETLMDHLTSPYVIIGGFVPALVAVTAGQLLRNRYIGRAQAVERSVHDSYAADDGPPAP